MDEKLIESMVRDSFRLAVGPGALRTEPVGDDWIVYHEADRPTKADYIRLFDLPPNYIRVKVLGIRVNDPNNIGQGVAYVVNNAGMQEEVPLWYEEEYRQWSTRDGLFVLRKAGGEYCLIAEIADGR